ncbi:sensor histidine kinase [Litoreibacter roseus]|uniref:histidine kinase n=2 Tax=Litoreibacter roseus TaxID=2601869 RepID=A0A6N6JFN4_9RHOB|nr:sensor histidine kinase [Litoreibacter roseus]
MIGGGLWLSAAIVTAIVTLSSFINTVTLNRFDELLLERQLQIVVALNNTGGDPELLGAYLTDPAYERPYSGRYWQAESDDGVLLTSRSLFDSLLKDHTADAPSEPALRTGLGPENERIRAVTQKIIFEDDSVWTVIVAESMTDLLIERAKIRQNVLIAFGFVGVLGFIGALLQMSMILRPLSALRYDVAHRWDSGKALDPQEYPEEVAPLVEDINALMTRNRDIIERSRRQAADLAHALKTPSAIARNELSSLAAADMDVGSAMDALDRIDAQLGRSLARIRASNAASAPTAATDMTRTIERMGKLFRSMAAKRDKEIRINVADGLQARIDAQDIEEVLGNVIDNALKWCATTVTVDAWSAEGGTFIRVDDDGPGIPQEDRRTALRSGGRLDTSEPGTGLGLAIATDLLAAYGASLSLDASDQLGGLTVLVSLPHRSAPLRQAQIPE